MSTLKAQFKVVADDSLNCFKTKIRLDISYKLSARHTIHMKCKTLFLEKKKCLIMPFAAGVTSALKVISATIIILNIGTCWPEQTV